MPQAINYHNPIPTRPRTCPPLAFWTVYFACAGVCFLWLMELLEIQLHGRPGDVVVKTAELVAILATAVAIAFLNRLYVRHFRPAVALLTVAALGLFSPLFGYLFLWIFF